MHPDFVDPRTLEGVWRFNGDRDYTIEFILNYGKNPARGILHLREGKLITRVQGHIEDTVDIVDFIQGEGEALIALADDSPVGRRLATAIINEKNIMIRNGFINSDDSPFPRPLPEGYYTKVK